MPAADVPIIQDLGILISEDMVAVEQASIDMLAAAEPLPQSLAFDKQVSKGEDILMKLHHKPYLLQVEEAERLGIGTRKYDLVRI
ncbi:MAG: 4Fe-4S ferredoxin iron-sulfur binding domain protein [Nitrospirae bacterium]|nr:4Fe-4S ferredoxin iron-sulfur binding domain protein [Nitrospirota bacterium]